LHDASKNESLGVLEIGLSEGTWEDMWWFMDGLGFVYIGAVVIAENVHHAILTRDWVLVDSLCSGMAAQHRFGVICVMVCTVEVATYDCVMAPCYG
jgi:hypothetical protein